MRSYLTFVVGSLLLLGCQAENSVVTLNFPVERTFLFSDRGEVLVVPVEREGLCPELVSQVLTGDPPTATEMTDSIPICDFRSQGVTVGPQPEGLHAYIAVVRDDRGAAILTGCRIEDLPGSGGVPLTLVLTMTAEYNNRYGPAATPSCGDIETKCRGGC